jgi:hypothetical protein
MANLASSLPNTARDHATWWRCVGTTPEAYRELNDASARVAALVREPSRMI